MLKKNEINHFKLIKYYKFINHNLIYNNKAINRYKKENYEISVDKAQKLNLLKKSLINLKNCELKKYAKNIVFGDGNPKSKIIFSPINILLGLPLPILLKSTVKFFAFILNCLSEKYYIEFMELEKGSYFRDGTIIFKPQVYNNIFKIIDEILDTRLSLEIVLYFFIDFILTHLG